MKFMFSNPQKYVLSSALKDSKEGLLQKEMDPEYKKSILKKIDRTINQLQYNSYISEIHEEIGTQLFYLLESVDALLKQTDTTEFDDDAHEDLKLKTEVVEELITLFTEYMKKYENQDNDLANLMLSMNEVNLKYNTIQQKCSMCDGKAYYRIKRFGKVCKSCKDKMSQKVQDLQKEIDNPEKIDDNYKA